MAADPMTLKWRLGKKPFRTIYALTGGKSTADVLVGSMQTAAIAKQLVDAHNAPPVQPTGRPTGGF